MNKTQLDVNIAQKIVDDNPQYRFLAQLLPLYDHFRRTRKAAGNSTLSKVDGWVARNDRHRNIIINRETFYIDEDDFVVTTTPEPEMAWYLGLRGCEKSDDIINFNLVKKLSSNNLLYYNLDTTVPVSKQKEYLKLGN